MTRPKGYLSYLCLSTLIIFSVLASPLFAEEDTVPQVRPVGNPDAPLKNASFLIDSLFHDSLVPSKACQIMDIACGELVDARLDFTDCQGDTGNRVDIWQFTGQSGDRVEINAASDDFDTVLILFDPDVDEAAEDDDGGEGFNSRIVHTLDSSGTWTIWVANFDPFELGDYVLSLECAGAPTPAAPSMLTAAALSTTEIGLDWRDNSNNEDEFRIEIRQSGIGEPFRDIGSMPAGSRDAVVFNLQPDTTYDFRVRARNSAGNSGYSNIATEATLANMGGCRPSETVLCLRDGRFMIETGRMAQEGYLSGVIVTENDGSGVMYFSSDTKWELMVNVQPRAGRYWLSASGLTEGREYDVTVSDLVTGDYWWFILPDWNPRETNAPLSFISP